MRLKLKGHGKIWFSSFLLCILVVTSGMGVINGGPRTHSAEAPPMAPLAVMDTGDLILSTTDFTSWTGVNVSGTANGLYLALDGQNHRVSVLADSSLSECARFAFDSNEMKMVQYEDPCNGGNPDYTHNLGVDDWYQKNGNDWSMTYMKLGFVNPAPSKQYYNVSFETRAKAFSPYNADGAVTFCVNDTNPYVHWVPGLDGKPTYFRSLGSHSIKIGYQISDTYANEFQLDRDIENPAYLHALQYNEYAVAPHLSDLGETYLNTCEAVCWRYQRDWGDVSNLLWDFAEFTFAWYQYQPSGWSVSPNYTLSDGDHEYKTLNNVSVSGIFPAGTGHSLEYRAETPLGWTTWIPIASGERLAALVKQIQLRFNLTAETSDLQATPTITAVTLNYGDPKTAAAPQITNITQSPEAVGYLDAVNVSCTILTYGPLSQVVINYTIDGWDTFALANMTDHFEQYGTNPFWGTIPVQPYGTTVQYKIFAQNRWGDQTLNATSSECNYTVIDNIPPEILHTNSSAWVMPLHPLAPEVTTVIDYIHINCSVTDLFHGPPASVILTISSDVFYSKETYPMNSSDSFYSKTIMLKDNMHFLLYNITATDTLGNTVTTPDYTITIDRFGPEIISWTEPADPEYNDPVWVLANITDPNNVATVAGKWKVNGANETDLILQPYGPPGTYRSDNPIAAKSYLTQVEWDISATDDGGFTTEKTFSYLVADETDPLIIGVQFITPVVDGMDCIVNFTIQEPVGASGIDLNRLYVRYWVSSVGFGEEDYFVLTYSAGIWGAGNDWYAVIPAQEYNETVVFYIEVYDKAGNQARSDGYLYIVKESALLIDWISFAWWALIMGCIAGVFSAYRRSSASKGTSRLKGTAFVGLGMAVEIGVTAALWYTVLPWFDIRNLSWQEWMLSVGQTESWILVFLIFVGILTVFAASLGLLYQVDSRADLKAVDAEIDGLIQRIDADLDEKYK